MEIIIADKTLFNEYYEKCVKNELYIHPDKIKKTIQLIYKIRNLKFDILEIEKETRSIDEPMIYYLIANELSHIYSDGGYEKGYLYSKSILNFCSKFKSDISYSKIVNDSFVHGFYSYKIGLFYFKKLKTFKLIGRWNIYEKIIQKYYSKKIHKNNYYLKKLFMIINKEKDCPFKYYYFKIKIISYSYYSEKIFLNDINSKKIYFLNLILTKK